MPAPTPHDALPPRCRAVTTASQSTCHLADRSSPLILAPQDADLTGRPSSTIVVSEFVGCSPSLSGALRMNPWSIESVKECFFSALTMPLRERVLRHAKHWRYVSSHTVAFWTSKLVAEMQVRRKSRAKVLWGTRGWGERREQGAVAIGGAIGGRNAMVFDAPCKVQLSMSHVVSGTNLLCPCRRSRRTTPRCAATAWAWGWTRSA